MGEVVETESILVNAEVMSYGALHTQPEFPPRSLILPVEAAARAACSMFFIKSIGNKNIGRFVTKRIMY